MTVVGRVSEIVRYPVKSMAGTATESATIGWHGVDGDRRFAFRRAGADNGFPWLTASRLPELLRYRPVPLGPGPDGGHPTHVRTPAGAELAIGGEELNALISERFGSAVDLMRINQGIFDEAPLSLITLATITRIGREVGVELDRRRFRANLFLDTGDAGPFVEDGWVGRSLVFGDGDTGPAVSVMLCDARCMMVNLDPDTAVQDGRVLKTVARINHTNAGVYATITRTGAVRIGDPVTLIS